MNDSNRDKMNKWKIGKYMVRGLSHSADDLCCQDYVEIRRTERKIVISLADGLGSLKHSDIAAKAICIGCCEKMMKEDYVLSSFSSEAFLKEFVDYLAHLVIEAGDRKGYTRKDLDCTFAFVYIDTRENGAIIGRIGDSAIGVIKQSLDQSFVLTEKKNSANGTSAILDIDAFQNFEFLYIDNIDDIVGFIVCSDGLDSEIYLKGSTMLRKAAEKYINVVGLADNSDIADMNLERIVAELVSSDRRFDDDISIGVVTKASEEIILPEEPTWLCTCGTRNPLDESYCINCQNDFVDLYKKVIFKKHGGKANFFKEINKDLQAELRILGIDRMNPTEMMAPPDLIVSENNDVSTNSTKKENLDGIVGKDKGDLEEDFETGKSKEIVKSSLPNTYNKKSKGQSAFKRIKRHIDAVRKGKKACFEKVMEFQKIRMKLLEWDEKNNYKLMSRKEMMELIVYIDTILSRYDKKHRKTDSMGN